MDKTYVARQRIKKEEKILKLIYYKPEQTDTKKER